MRRAAETGFAASYADEEHDGLALGRVEAGPKGISAFVVEKNTPGLSFGRQLCGGRR